MTRLGRPLVSKQWRAPIRFTPDVTLGHVLLQVDILSQAVRDAIAAGKLGPADIDFLNRQVTGCVRFLDRSLDPLTGESP